MKYLLTILFIIAASFGYHLYAQTKQPSMEGTAKVLRIVDGDTIHVLIDGKYETVRLIGINTPELKDTRPQVKCFAEKARNKANELLDGKDVILVSDPMQTDRDKYQRLLRYVFVGPADFNLYMIQQGYAYEYTYSKPYKYQNEFKAAQKAAESGKLGLWGSTCGN